MLSRSGSRFDPGALLAFFVVVAAALQIHVWGLDLTPFHTKGEPREALVVQSIHQGNGWILPRRNAVEIPSKPPFFHWLGEIAGMARGGLDEASVRLPSAVSSVLAAVLVCLVGILLWNSRIGLSAALVLLTAFEWQRAATTARVDMVHGLGVTMTFLGLLLYRKRGGWPAKLLFYVGIVWAVMSKGPIGLALPIGMLIALVFTDRGASRVRGLRPFRGLTLTIILCTVWYALAYLEGGHDFFTRHILFENLNRVRGGAEYAGGHQHSLGYLVGSLLLGFLPWTSLLPLIPIALWRMRPDADDRRSLVFLFLWIVVVFSPYAIASSKRGVYLLGLYPPLALLIAWSIDRLTMPRIEVFRALGTILSGLALLLSLVVGVLAVAVFLQSLRLPVFEIAAEFFARDVHTILISLAESLSTNGFNLGLLLTVAAGGLALAARVAWNLKWDYVFLSLFLVTSAVTLATRQFILPVIGRADSREVFVEFVREYVNREEPPLALYTYRHFDYGTIFYWGKPIPVLTADLSAEGPPLVLASTEEWEATPLEGRMAYEPIHAIASTGKGNMGEMLLLRRVAQPTDPTVTPATIAETSEEPFIEE